MIHDDSQYLLCVIILLIDCMRNYRTNDGVATIIKVWFLNHVPAAKESSYDFTATTASVATRRDYGN